MKCLYLTFLLCLSFWSCKTEYKDSSFVENNDSLIIVLNKPSGGYYYPKVNTFTNNDTCFLYYFSRSTSSIHLFPISGKEKIIDLTPSFENRINYYGKYGVSFYMNTPDLIWIDSPEDDSLYHVNINTLTIQHAVSKKLNDDIYLLDLIEPYIISDSNMYLGIYGDNQNSTFGLFRCENNSLQRKTLLGFLPFDYFQKEMYVKSGMITPISNDSILVSYYYSDSVDLYIGNLFSRRIELKSDSSINFSGLIGDSKNINAISKLFAMDQRYNQLFYDKKQQLYYRIFSFGKQSIGKFPLVKNGLFVFLIISLIKYMKKCLMTMIILKGILFY